MKKASVRQCACEPQNFQRRKVLQFPSSGLADASRIDYDLALGYTRILPGPSDLIEVDLSDTPVPSHVVTPYHVAPAEEGGTIGEMLARFYGSQETSEIYAHRGLAAYTAE